VGEITVTADKNQPILNLISPTGPTTIPSDITDKGEITVTANKDKPVLDLINPTDVGEITIDATKDNAANTTVTASKDNVPSSNNTVSLLSPSVVPSKSTSTSKTPGSSSAALLGQALGTTQPDTSLVGGSPILDGEKGKKRNVWNTESLKSALGIV